jgi:hypothetical protein
LVLIEQWKQAFTHPHLVENLAHVPVSGWSANESATFLLKGASS